MVCCWLWQSHSLCSSSTDNRFSFTKITAPWTRIKITILESQTHTSFNLSSFQAIYFRDRWHSIPFHFFLFSWMIHDFRVICMHGGIVEDHRSKNYTTTANTMQTDYFSDAITIYKSNIFLISVFVWTWCFLLNSFHCWNLGMGLFPQSPYYLNVNFSDNVILLFVGKVESWHTIFYLLWRARKLFVVLE